MHCPICGGASSLAGKKESSRLKCDFFLRRCENCYFAFVENPCLDYEKIYDEDYYNGRGIDPLVNYVQELKKPSSSIRNLEWETLLFFIKQLKQQGEIRNILDYGCGHGLAADFLNKNGYSAEGWDFGWLAGRSRELGLPVKFENPVCSSKKYDLIFALEVLEHVPNPLETLKEIHSLLRPGGVFFLTTGNAMPHWNHLLDWGYFRPEIHISLFTPNSLKIALERSGFAVLNHKYSNVFDGMVAYKILKNLRVNSFLFYDTENHSAFTLRRIMLKIFFPLLRPLLRYVDKKYGISAMPYGVAQ